MLVHVGLTLWLLALTSSFVTLTSAEYFDYGKHYEPYEYHGDAYSKYDVNRDGVDDRLDLDRNGKIDKYEAKYKHGYGVHPHKHHHSNDKYPKYPKKYEYHKKDDKDHYAPSYAKKHAPHYAHKLSDSYDANRKWGRKSTSYSSKHDYDTKKHDGYGSYSGVSYGKRKTRAHGYDDDNKYLKVPSFHSRSKHSDYYDKKDYDYDYKKDRKYDLYEKDYGYARRHRRYHGKDDHPDGKSYDKYDVTDYDLHPDGKYSKTNTKVYRATSYHKHDKYDKYERDHKYHPKHDRYGYDRKHYERLRYRY